MAYDKNKMQDISAIERHIWLQYLEDCKNGDFDSAQQLLADNPNMKYKILNAFNWNRLQNLVNDATETSQATANSLVGMWNAGYKLLQSASMNFKYRGEWGLGIEYNENNCVKLDQNHAYFCIQSHVSTNTSKPPNAAYWLLAYSTEEPHPIVVSSSKPANYIAGDIYIKSIT